MLKLIFLVNFNLKKSNHAVYLSDGKALLFYSFNFIKLKFQNNFVISKLTSFILFLFFFNFQFLNEFIIYYIFSFNSLTLVIDNFFFLIKNNNIFNFINFSYSLNNLIFYLILFNFLTSLVFLLNFQLNSLYDYFKLLVFLEFVFFFY